MKNIRLKLWSVLVAVCTAFFVNSQSNAGVVTYVVPVELQNLPPDKTILVPTSPQAQVKVRGPSYLLSSIGSSPPVFRVRVPKDAGNRFTIRLQEDRLDIPPAVEVQSIEPPEIEFILDDVVGRKMKVEVARIGQLEGHLRLKGVSIEPALIDIAGPKTELDSIKILETAPLDMRELKESGSRLLEVRNPGKFTRLSVDRVKVVVNIQTTQIERKFSRLPIEIRSTGGGSYRSNPDTANVEVSGAKPLVEKLEAKAIIPFVKVDNGSIEKQVERKVQLDLPEGISLVYVRPETVRLEKIDVGANGEASNPQ